MTIIVLKLEFDRYRNLWPMPGSEITISLFSFYKYSYSIGSFIFMKTNVDHMAKPLAQQNVNLQPEDSMCS